MSKVIRKIGPATAHVDKEEFNEIQFGEAPKTKIKWAKNHTVVMFDRNPFYLTITEEPYTSDLCGLLEMYQDTGDVKYINMIMNNIASVITSDFGNNVFGEWSESIINALRNSRNIGRRVQDTPQ